MYPGIALRFGAAALQIALELRIRHQDRGNKGDGAHERDLPIEIGFRPAVLEPERDVFGGAAEDRIGNGVSQANAHRAHFGREHFHQAADRPAAWHDRFVARLEWLTGRALKPGKRGPKRLEAESG